jgi:hypothetical protein
VLLVAGFVAQVAWRLHLSLPLTGPVVHPDEDGYLLAARILAGGPTATLPTWSIMRPMGYPLVLAPIYWFVQEPTHVYVGVHIVNALLLAATFPLLYVFGRRVLPAGRAWTAAAAFAVALLPSLVYFGEFALTDVLLPVLFLGVLIAVHAMLAGRHRAVAGAVAGVLAGYAAATHVRGLVVLVLLGCLVALGLGRRWLGWRVAAATAAGAGLLYAVGYVVNAWLRRHLFPGGGPFQVDGRVLDRLTSVHGAWRVLADGAGQIWYLLTSTYSLAGIGLAAAVLALVRPRDCPRPTRVVLAFALLTTLGTAFATATGIPDEGRLNNHIYGRYVAYTAGVWVLVALAALARAGWRRGALLGAGSLVIQFGTLGLVWLYAHPERRGQPYVSFDAPEISFLSHDYGAPHFRRLTVLTILFTAAFVLLFVLRPGPVAAVAGLVVLNVAAMLSINGGITESWGERQNIPGPPQLVRDAHIPPGSSVFEATNVPWTVSQRHQREVYWSPLTQFNSRAPLPGRPAYVVAATDWPGRRYGYVEVLSYHEPKRAVWVVWQRG